MSTTKEFNFRHLMDAAGVTMSNKNNWAVGQMLRSIAAKHDCQPNRILTEKTNPNPSVAAPHCIAHYPMSLFPAALDELKALMKQEEAQLSLDL